MEILRTIRDYAQKRAIKFVLIGGHALNIHGVSRTTSDLDLMVDRKDLELWKEFLDIMRYSIYRETTAFLQSRPQNLAGWPIDLMLVATDTLEKAVLEGKPLDNGTDGILVASLGHLIAMKLHALKSNQASRVEKDLGDIRALVAIGQLDVNSEDFRQLCLKYGSIEVYERITKATEY